MTNRQWYQLPGAERAYIGPVRPVADNVGLEQPSDSAAPAGDDSTRSYALPPTLADLTLRDAARIQQAVRALVRPGCPVRDTLHAIIKTEVDAVAR